MFFVLLILKNFLINSIKHIYKNYFLEFGSQTQFFFFFSENTKNCSQKLFFKTVFKNSYQTGPRCSKIRYLSTTIILNQDYVDIFPQDTKTWVSRHRPRPKPKRFIILRMKQYQFHVIFNKGFYILVPISLIQYFWVN